MKKIIVSVFAAAALAACTKYEVQYDQPESIGFQIVSGKMTKAAVDDTDYPTGLNIYVFAQTSDNAAGTADYLDNAEFKYESSATQDGKNLWAGADGPYYWPNVKTLYFAGVSKSGNVGISVVPAYQGGKIVIDGYEAASGTSVEAYNDLLWFPKTAESYGKGTPYVPVVMKHACSWITIKLWGDDYTAGKYNVTDIHIEGLTTKGRAELGSTAEWILSTEAADTDKVFTVFTGNEELPDRATEQGFETVADNTIVLPNQVPGTLYITYQYESQAGETIEETVSGSLKYNGDDAWQPGYHYTYTVQITASQILIAPEVADWTPSPATGGHEVAVQQ